MSVCTLVRSPHDTTLERLDHHLLRQHERVQLRARPVLPTGVAALDMLTGAGGLPSGRLVELYGPAASGKTTLALLTAAGVIGRGQTVAYLDLEHRLEAAHLACCGVDPDQLHLYRPETGEAALDLACALARLGGHALIVIDTWAALIPQREWLGVVDDADLNFAATYDRALRKLAAICSHSGCCLLILNQVRQDPKKLFGDPEITPGDGALGHYASLRLAVRSLARVKDQSGKVTGITTEARVKKNSVGLSYGQARFDLVLPGRAEAGRSHPGENGCC